MLLQKERELIVEYGKKLSAAGLCPGTSGNVSIYNRELNLMAISPSGMDYDIVTPEDIIVSDLDAHVIEGCRKPSSEWELHSVFYKQRPDINAVVHTHSIYCTTFAVLNQPLKAVHFAISDAGTASIPCAPYALFGSHELAELAIEHCKTGNAVLLANHGIICCGKDIAKAYSLANNLEYVAQLQYQAMSIGKPCIISDEEMENVLIRFKSYGQTPK